MTTTETNGPAPATAPGRIRIDMSELTLDELAEIDEEVWQRLGCRLDEALADHRQKRAMAIMAWLVHRREDPAYTIEDAGRLRPMRDLELVSADPETLGAGIGDAPRPSPASGA